MTQPAAYTPATDFEDYLGTAQGTKLDAEFAAIKATLDDVRTNLAVIQRDDTLLGNSTVHPSSLTTATLALLTSSTLTPRGLWVTATAYAVGDLAEESGTTYVCGVAHTSGTFATDYAAEKWNVINSSVLTEGTNSSSPNATIPVVSITPGSGGTNVDLALVPKGTGSLLGQVSNGAASGGNKRGRYVVDLQLARGFANQVAETNYSAILSGYGNRVHTGEQGVICGGSGNVVGAGSGVVVGGSENSVSALAGAVVGGVSNVASNSYASILGGSSNHATGQYSVVVGGLENVTVGASSYSAILGGTGNSITGAYSNIVGGQTNAVVAQWASVIGGLSNSVGTDGTDGLYSAAGGRSNAVTGDYGFAYGRSGTASGDYSVTFGYLNINSSTYGDASGYNANTRSLHGKAARGIASLGGATGDTQTGNMQLAAATTNGSTVTMTADGGAATTSNQLVLQNNQAMLVTGRVLARQSVTQSNAAAYFDFKALIKRGANAAATSLVASVTPTLVANDITSIVAGSLAVTADTTNGCLKLAVTGVAATNIYWLAELDTVELIYA